MDSKFDANSNNTMTAVTNDVAKTPMKVLIDPVTGYLKIKVALGGAPAGVSANQKLDANQNFTLGAFDGTNIRGLKVDPTTKYLLVKF